MAQVLGCLAFVLMAGATGLLAAGAFTGHWLEGGTIGSIGFVAELGLFRYCPVIGDCDWVQNYALGGIGEQDWWIATEALVGVGILFCFFGLICSPCYLCKKSSNMGRGVSLDILLGSLIAAAGLICFYVKWDDDNSLTLSGTEFGWSYFMAWGGVACGLVSCILSCCSASREN